MTSKLIKSLKLQELEKEDASQADFQSVIDSDLLTKKEKHRVIYNLDEVGSEKISDSVLNEDKVKNEV